MCTYLYECSTNVYVSVRICTYMVRMCTYICCLDYGLDHGVHICTHAFAHSGICWIVPFSDLHCILAARPVQLSVAWGHSESESRAVTNNLRFNHALVSGVPHHVWFTLLWFVQWTNLLHGRPQESSHKCAGVCGLGPFQVSRALAVTNNLRLNHALVSGVPHHVAYTSLVCAANFFGLCSEEQGPCRQQAEMKCQWLRLVTWTSSWLELELQVDSNLVQFKFGF